jgi:hypothetical protein
MQRGQSFQTLPVEGFCFRPRLGGWNRARAGDIRIWNDEIEGRRGLTGRGFHDDSPPAGLRKLGRRGN